MTTLEITDSGCTAIHTKYLGPTDHRGARILATKAERAGVRVTIGYDSALSATQNHIAGARALCDKLGWKGRLIGGHDTKGMVFVFRHDH